MSGQEKSIKKNEKEKERGLGKLAGEENSIKKIEKEKLR